MPGVRPALHRQVPPDRVHEVRPGAVPRLRPGAHRQVSPQELRRPQIIIRKKTGIVRGSLIYELPQIQLW